MLSVERLSRYRWILAPLYVTLLPIVLCRSLLLAIWRSGVPRAWDGTGHYGIAQIYAQTIFPDTFGWTNAHLAGMPFPNFYPPLFFWCVAFLAKMQLFSFLTAFKLIVLLPLLLIPAAIFFLGWSVSNNDLRIAFWSAMVSVLPLTSSRFGGQLRWASGLDYFSTLSIGMYTQPLGFVLLLAWYAVYYKAHLRLSRFILSTFLLAAAVLGNYLNVITATIIVAATLLFDVVDFLRNRYDSEARRALIVHTLSPVCSAALTLFWVVPMLDSYGYFVTRPFPLVIVTRDMITWFVVAIVGIVCWLLNRTRATAPYIAVCVVLASILSLSQAMAPRWLPLQANRLSPTLYFFLAIPVAYALTTVYQTITGLLFRWAPRAKPYSVRFSPYVLGLFLIVLVGYYYSVSLRPNIRFFNDYQARLAFYPKVVSATPPPAPRIESTTSSAMLTLLNQHRPSELNTSELLDSLREDQQDTAAMINAAKSSMDNILAFARERHDGRYAVEIPAQYRTDAASFDGRALNSYLGAQGNQTLTVVFREASPNSIFMFPQVGAISYNPDNFGFSSVLGDDLDFNEQPLAKHLDRMRYLGARYIVINSDKVKTQLAQEPAIGARYDFGTWSIFELRDGPAAPIRELPFRPALVVTSFTVKGRRGNEYNFVRFAEEQFADDWFDVLLARAPTMTLDNLGSTAELNQFGAIILDTYDCERCDLVYRQLKQFAQTRPLILLARDNSFCNRIKASLSDFPKATVIERDEEDSGGPWLDNYAATRRYRSSPQRAVWTQIRTILENNKIPTDPANVQGDIGPNWIRLRYDGPSLPVENSVPVLISTTYHPNWQAQRGQTVYAATPMFMLTFVRQPTTPIVFARRPLDRAGVWLSAATLIGLVGVGVGHRVWRSRSARRTERRPAVVTEVA
jgi:hypothetical protein